MFFTILALTGDAHAQQTHQVTQDPFPVFESLKPAIEFWKKVYTRYSTSEGIIHDREHVEIIYEIIELMPPQSHGGRKANKRRVKAVKKNYQTILKKLARGRPPQNSSEKSVAALFGENAKPSEYRAAAKRIRFQLGQKDRFRRGLIRSGAYLEQIKHIFRQHGLPEVLAYLPHVESSFNYKAYSKFGAAGIWQFTRATGKRYLTIDYTLDERRDPIRASHAAARYLKHNYEKLESWPLAITAYNHGTRGMERAKKNVNGNYEAIFNSYNGRRFGFASRNFYAEFLAAKEISEDYTKFFADLQLDPPVRTVEIVLPDYVALEDLADHFELDVKLLAHLNPALRRSVYQARKYVPKGYRLRLPEKNGIDTTSLRAQIPAPLLKTKQKPSRFYRVQRGDTASRVARLHGVRLEDLILANQLNRRATIYVGQNLRIPTQGEKLLLASVDKKIVKKAKRPEPQVPSVKKESLAKKKEQTQPLKVIKQEDELPEKREMAGYQPKTEQRPQDESSNREAAVETLEMVNPAVISGNLLVESEFEEGGKTIGIIRVEVEETLGHYADWLQIPTWRIRRLNAFGYGRPIHARQTIKIPFGTVGKNEFEEKRYEYHKEIEEDFFSAYSVESIRSYRVQKGDNIWTLCREEFDLPFWLIKKYNPSQDFDKFLAGQKIQVPVVSKKIGKENGTDLVG